MKEVRFVSLCGMLGYGYPLASLEAGMAARPDFLGVDAGSTDPGPYYLGAGVGFVKRMQVQRDLEPALTAARKAEIPLVIGTAGGAGGSTHVDTFLGALREIATRNGLRFRLAVIRADVKKGTVLQALGEGRVRPCGPSGELTEERVRSCSHLVAQMGTGPIVRAIEAGADVVVAGRCCDTAIFAALPIRRGFDAGLALHAAKIAECGTLCATPGGANDSLICRLREDHFVVEPANPAKRCTPETVAAHSLYEQPDPNGFYEPEGFVDLADCEFEPEGERGVRVSGSRLAPALQPTLKVEGAALRGYRSVTIAGARDPMVIARLDEIEAGVRRRVRENLGRRIAPEDLSLRFIRYGQDGVMGSLEADRTPPIEVGIVIEAIAPTQELASAALSLARSTALHQPFEGRKTTAGNLAFPFSPSDLRGGPVYEFAVYHLMEVEDPDAGFAVELEEV